MTFQSEAVYENGVLRPAAPLPLDEHQKVELVIKTERSWAEQTAGILAGTAILPTCDASRRTMSSAFWERDDILRYSARRVRFC